MILEDKISVNVSAEKAYNWILEHMKDTESYKEWHPDHLSLNWVKGEACKEGSILVAEEYINKILYKLRCKFIRLIPGKLIRYRMTFPMSLIAPFNEFIFESTSENKCNFIARGKINFSEKFMLKVHSYHEIKLAKTRQHMKEEGENLKKSLESRI